jgi:hypothetical protein
MRENDFTPTGIKLEGAYENDRNADARDCFKAVIREAYGVQDVIIAHHLVYVREEKRPDGFAYQIVEEIPAADTLLFDHDVARKIWGSTAWRDVLTRLAVEPPETRDDLFMKLYNARDQNYVAQTSALV